MVVVVVVGWGPHLILITAIPTTELQQSPGKVDDDDHPTGNDNGQDDTIESAFEVQESMMEKVHKTKWFALIFSNVGWSGARMDGREVDGGMGCSSMSIL